MDFITTNTALIGIIAFVVSVITQLTKEVGFLSKIPTTLQVIVLSVVGSVGYYFANCAITGVAVVWYSVIFAVVVGFISAFVATYGWDKLNELWQRFKKIEPEKDVDDGTKG